MMKRFYVLVATLAVAAAVAPGALAAGWAY